MFCLKLDLRPYFNSVLVRLGGCSKRSSNFEGTLFQFHFGAIGSRSVICEH